MRVTKLETLRLDSIPTLLFVRIHTDEGLTGLGETNVGAQAVEAYLHESVASRLLGRDPSDIEELSVQLYDAFVGYGGTGVETRGNSAVDIALWDIAGEMSGQPLYQLLGGRVRRDIRTYNTCAGYGYVHHGGDSPRRPSGPYEDLDAFLNRADELAQSLLAEGINGMKIWPFDHWALESRGAAISKEGLKAALEPFEKIRRSVGDRIDIMVELHGLWQLPGARQIVKALEDYRPFWIEDPIKAHDLEAVADLRHWTATPITLGETLGWRWAFKELVRARAADIVMFDVGWVGGITEAKKVAALVGAAALPVAPHDCTGPVAFVAGTHLSVHLPNAVIQESVRAYYTGWYRDLVTNLPIIEEGRIRPPEGPGLGTELLPGLEMRSDVHVRVSDLDSPPPWVWRSHMDTAPSNG